MDLENILLSEISQTGKHKYYLVSFTCGTQKNNPNESMYKTETDSQT